MARRLKIGFDQGPPTLVAATGKYGILHPNLSFTTSGSNTRRYVGGHGVAFQNNQVWTGTPYNPGSTYHGIPNPTTISDVGPVTTDTRHIMLRHEWGQIETTTNPASLTYDFSSITQDLAQVATLTTLRDAARASAGMPAFPPILLYVMVEWKSFNGLVLLPKDLIASSLVYADGQNVGQNAGGTGVKTYATHFVAGGNPGFMDWVWDTTVLGRLQQIYIALGSAFNSNANFGGIVTQETSTSGGTAGASNPVYSGTNYINALTNISDYVEDNFPNGRLLFYLNFITGASAAQIYAFLAHLQPQGTILTGPDLVETGGLTTSTYPYLKAYHLATNGIPAPGPIGSSVQPSEWSANGFPAGQAWMRSLFNYLTSSFKYTQSSTGVALTNYTTTSAYGAGGGDFLMWNYVTTAQAGNFNQKYNNNSTEIQHDYPTFGTFVP